jgi:HEPN domain-containing protein
MNGTPDASRALAHRWFQKAENDLLNVQNNLKAGRYPADTVCFHCQQAAEKYLKGMLAWHEVPLVRTHDLLELLKQVVHTVGDGAAELSPHLLLLDQYSIAVRYPQEYEASLGEEQVQAAVEAAYAVRTWVRRILGLGENEV